ncbi:unnamed protein product, partial [Iphiclides podalirius]
MHDWILAQINVIDDCEENFQHNNEAGNLRNAINTLNQVTLNLSKGLCAHQEKARELVANARRFHRILDKDLEEVLRDSALFPKSCICSEDRCVSKTCVKSCENACLLKYRLGRWSCPGFNDSTSVHLNAICDGKFDCFDESDERDCSEGKGRGKFEANEAFLKVTKVLEMKMASKENEPVRNELLRLYKSIIFLQHLISASNPNTKYIKIVRDRSFTLLSLIYGNYMRHTYNSNDAEQMYRFLYAVNKILVEALKRSYTGNTKLISSNDCICRKDKCIKLKCSPNCVRACSVESKLTRYYCKESPDNSSVAIGALCNGKKNCPNGDDEINCSAEICRRHHLYSLRLSIQDVGKYRDGTGLGEILKFWRTKASSILLLAEANIGRPTPQYLRQIVKDLLQDLVFAYASFETNKKNIADTAFREFFDLSQRVIYALKTCGKYVCIIFLSFPVSFASAMFRWLEEDTFDCVVGIAIDNSPAGIATFVHDRLLVTAANPLYNVAKHRIKIFAINGNPHSSRTVVVDYITTHRDRNNKWVRIGSNSRHTTIYDLTLISVADNETVFPKHQTLPRRPYYLPLAERESKATANGWTLAGFGFANKRHVRNSNILRAVVYRDQVMVDCRDYLPPAWGDFICILNVENFAAVQSGMPLLHQGVVYGVGSFSYVKDKESILVFTDVRPYRGKLAYLYTIEWWRG